MLAALLCLLISCLPPGTAGVEHLCRIYHGFQVVEFEAYDRSAVK